MSTSRESFTVIACATNASNIVLPLKFMFKGKTITSLNSFVIAEALTSCHWTLPVKAWIEDRLGLKEFKNYLLQFCDPHRPTGPYSRLRVNPINSSPAVGNACFH
ncbi:hypothetical protein PoB_007273400 [Plakobranchus ocellatus]|uniref:DDE-1 domain-containing protein n=1 Tax=Plakobranchus ocellatus TaxID=259542 RepID=A0AAV4DQF6_9GAST|nr:hypothetical protein PoB_007273400 [Plakobranchus ocellatus]